MWNRSTTTSPSENVRVVKGVESPSMSADPGGTLFWGPEPRGQPVLRRRQFAINGALRDAQDMRDLLPTHLTEEAHLNDSALSRVNSFKILQRIVQRDQVLEFVRSNGQTGGELYVLRGEAQG